MVAKWINPGNVMYCMVTMVNNVVYLKIDKRVYLKILTTGKKNITNYVWW